MKTNAMVTIDNYEEYLMLAADGELDVAGMAALDAFLQAHPDLAAEAEVWKTSLKLQPDMELVYEQKEALLQKIPRQIVLTWKTCSIAAAAAIVFALFAIPTMLHHNNVPGIAHHFLQPAPMTTQVNDIAQTTSERRPNTLPQHSHVETSHTTQQRHPAQQKPESTAIDAVVSLSSEPPTPVNIPSIKQELSSVQLPGAIALVAEPENPQQSSNNSSPLRIHLAAPDASAVHMLKRGVEQRIADAAALAHSIRETAFAVRIGNKNHYLNF